MVGKHTSAVCNLFSMQVQCDHPVMAWISERDYLCCTQGWLLRVGWIRLQDRKKPGLRL